MLSLRDVPAEVCLPLGQTAELILRQQVDACHVPKWFADWHHGVTRRREAPASYWLACSSVPVGREEGAPFCICYFLPKQP